MLTALSIAVLYALLSPALSQLPTDAVLRLNKGVLSDGECDSRILGLRCCAAQRGQRGRGVALGQRSLRVACIPPPQIES